jgi:hypothetical protein
VLLCIGQNIEQDGVFLEYSQAKVLSFANQRNPPA